MAAPKKKTTAGETVPCPECKGALVVPGARYTDPDRPCPTCKGAGVVPKHEAAGEAEAE